MSLKIGDSVIAKAGTKEPDSEDFEIGGWHERVRDKKPQIFNSSKIIKPGLLIDDLN